MCTRVHVRVYTRVRVRTNGCKRGKAIDASTLCPKSAFSSLFALHICVFSRFFRLIIHREDSLISLFLFYLIRSSIRCTMARNDERKRSSRKEEGACAFGGGQSRDCNNFSASFPSLSQITFTFFEERKSLWTRVFGFSRLSSRRIGSDSWQVVDAQFDTVIARLYSCMQSEARIMLEPAAELLRILAVYRRKRRVLGDRKNI